MSATGLQGNQVVGASDHASEHYGAHHAHAPSGGGLVHFLRSYVFSTDHKIIGLQFLFSTLIWFFVGGMLAMAIRWQLAWPWQTCRSLVLCYSAAKVVRSRLSFIRRW